MSKLTNLEIRNAKGPAKLADGSGLFFEILASGVKRWLYRYKINGKGGKMVLGRYPDLSLKAVRVQHKYYIDLVRQGINPSRARRNQKTENVEKDRLERETRSNSFENIACQWIEKERGSWSRSHANAVHATLKNDVFPSLGAKPIDSITPPEVLLVLQKIEARGSLEMARKILQRMSAVFRYAIQLGSAIYNPAADMKGVIKSRQVEHMPAVFGRELSQLLRGITANQKIHTTTKLALQFTALTACRSREVRCAHWSEINLEEAEWHIPGERMKMKRGHIVPLSTQAVAILNRAAVLFGKEGLVFPSVRDRKKPMSDNAMSKAFRDMGYKGIATPHGFRSSFSSIANEKSGFPGEVIEKCLAHEEKNRIRAAYNRAEYLVQRRELMQWWGNKIQALEHGAQMITFKEKKTA